eukprot:154992-Rhodomonas_salina.4
MGLISSCDGDNKGSACFKLFDTPKKWSDAESSCVAWGGRLAAIQSGHENVVARLPVMMSDTELSSNMWIGLNDIDDEGSFTWTWGGSPMFTPWKSGQPNNHDGDRDCAAMEPVPASSFGVAEWGDDRCYKRKPYLCSAIWCDGTVPPSSNGLTESIHCYKFFSSPKSRADALAACQSWGGTLATITKS